ncbi:MAG: ATP-binding protein [Desulfuromonadales bacterium]
MEFKSPLSQRIIISFVLLTTVVSSLFSFGIMAAINMVEEDLVTAELNRKFPNILVDYRQGQNPQLDFGTQFYSGTEDLPYYLRDLKPGFSEVELEKNAFHVLMQKEKETPFYLVQEQTNLARHENLLQITVIAGFFLSVLASLMLGIIMSRRIIAPVRKLTDQVNNREKLLLDAPPLSTSYANDEVGRLATSFDRTISMLQQSLQRETLFTSDVSHELRTPLMVIKSSCDLLIEKNQLDDYSRQRINTISKAAREIQELVDAFLTLARGSATEQDCATLESIIQGNLKEWQQQSEAKGISFSLQDQTTKQGDRNKMFPVAMLRTVLINLVRNAIHHTAEGEITLVILPTGFEICDTGPGISDYDKQSIFKPFYRGESGRRNGMGLGLGLSLAQRICQREQWTIAVSDNTPVGCCFSVTLNK